MDRRASLPARGLRRQRLPLALRWPMCLRLPLERRTAPGDSRSVRRMDGQEPRRDGQIPGPALGPFRTADRPPRRVGRGRQARLPVDAARTLRHQANLRRAYEWHYLDIGYGVTITGPHTVARMTKPWRSCAATRCWRSAPALDTSPPISPISPTRSIRSRSSAAGRPHAWHSMTGSSRMATPNTRTSDPTVTAITAGKSAPFDKIIVTCGIDHIPPPLLQQLRPNGLMVIPVGPPGAQHVLKADKRQRRRGR